MRPLKPGMGPSVGRETETMISRGEVPKLVGGGNDQIGSAATPLPDDLYQRMREFKQRLFQNDRALFAVRSPAERWSSVWVAKNYKKKMISTSVHVASWAKTQRSVCMAPNPIVHPANAGLRSTANISRRSTANMAGEVSLRWRIEFLSSGDRRQRHWLAQAWSSV